MKKQKQTALVPVPKNKSAAEPTAMSVVLRLPKIPGKTPGERINYLHRFSMESEKASIAAAIMAGWELSQVRINCPHGTWLVWLRENTVLSKDTALRYMGLYEKELAEWRASRPKPVPASTRPGVKELETVCAGIDASSVTDLYVQQGLLKRNANHGGAREGAGRKAKGSVGEQLDAALRSAELAWLATAEHLDALEDLFGDPAAVARLNDERLSRLFSALSPICTAARRQLEARAKGNGRPLPAPRANGPSLAATFAADEYLPGELSL